MKAKYIEPEFIRHCNISQENVSYFVCNLGEVFSKLSLKPLGGSRIDWRKQVNFKKYGIDENNFLAIIENFLSNKDEMVNIYLDDGRLFDIKINAKLLYKCLKYIDEETFSYWIVSSSNKWIIESYNGTEVVIKENE